MAHQEMIPSMYTANAAVFLLYLPFRLWELHNSPYRVFPGAQDLIKLVGQQSL